MSDTPRTDGIMKYCFGSDREFVAVDFCRQLERELKQERQDRKQADLDTIRALGERNDARAEIEQIKATLANPNAVHLNMLRGAIQWTPAHLYHLLGQEPPNSKETA